MSNFAQKLGAKKHDRSGPYQKTYTNNAAPVDMTAEIVNGKYATSSLLVVATGAATFAWTDCAGNTNSISLPNGFNKVLPYAISVLGVCTNCIVTACWHAGP